MESLKSPPVSRIRETVCLRPRISTGPSIFPQPTTALSRVPISESLVVLSSGLRKELLLLCMLVVKNNSERVHCWHAALENNSMNQLMMEIRNAISYLHVLDGRIALPTPREMEAIAYVIYLATDCVNPEGRHRPTMMEAVNGLVRAFVAVSNPLSPLRSSNTKLQGT